MSYNVPNSQYDQQTSQDQYASPDNGTGLWSMIIGIVSLLIGGLFFGIPAIILGVIGRKKAAAGLATNGGQALAGLITGSIATAMSVIGIIILFGIRGS
jgi:hypothetical protein